MQVNANVEHNASQSADNRAQANNIHEGDFITGISYIKLLRIAK